MKRSFALGGSMGLSARELTKRREFGLEYRLGQNPAMQAVERAVCGCDYGSTAWTTIDEADRIAAALNLGPGLALLDIGSGSGWPTQYLAQRSGCTATLTDLPLDGLRIAIARAERNESSGKCLATVADAAHLPFHDESFDAVNHSDVLCCLVQKREVLSECRRVIRRGGLMAETKGLFRRVFGGEAPAGPEATEAAPRPSFFTRLKQGLTRSSNALSEGITSILNFSPSVLALDALETTPA